MRSGTAFLAPATRTQQEDLTRNPGMLWVEQGAQLWRAPEPATGKTCASCHQEPETLRGAALRYPRVDRETGALVNLELKINQCRTARQGAKPFAYESSELLALTALVALQSRGMTMRLEVDDALLPHLERGQAIYQLRQGQLNLSCSQCHDDNWGKRLRGETVSQGHANGYPIYRLEWQGLGSLHRRLRSCFNGVRAESLAPGSPEHIALELYLAWRAQGLSIETPAIRR